MNELSPILEELKAIQSRVPTACVITFHGDCPADTVIFIEDTGPEARAKEEVAECNKRLRHPHGITALFQGDGQFDYMSVKAAIYWLSDNETPWHVCNLNEYGSCVAISHVPARVITAYKERIEHLQDVIPTWPADKP